MLPYVNKGRSLTDGCVSGGVSCGRLKISLTG
jgi:hypothetical protein